MGSNPGKHQTRDEKLVYQAQQEDGTTFTSNEDDTALLLKTIPTPWRKNCIFTEDPVTLSDDLKLSLTVKGAGILRIGLTPDEPSSGEDFIKSSIITHEDGFEEEEHVRIIAVDAFNFVTYTDTDVEEGGQKVLGDVDESIKAWMYVIVIQGCPKITIKKDEKLLGLKTFSRSHIYIDSDEAVPGKTSSSGVCRLKEPVSVNMSYCINWQMKVQQHDKENHCSSRKYGFFRFGVVSELPESLNQLSLYSDQMHRQGTWFVESAISSQTYSEMIMFTINKESREITHNLSLSPAKEDVTEEFPLDCTKQLYLVLEVFHGDIGGVHKYQTKDAPKLEFPGHILLFKNFKADKSVPEHIQIGARFKTEPYRIQYGTDPTLVLAEFRRKFQDKSLKHLQENGSLPWDSVEEVRDSSKIQVLDVPDDVTSEDLETFFSNKSVCGGGKIKDVSKTDYISGCWVIKYKHKNDARTVWQDGTYRLNDTMVTVLPYYDQLGPTANYGLKPEFDTSDMEVVIEDENRMSYISTVDKERFEQHMKSLNLRVIWPSVQEPEFEEETDDEDNRGSRIILECNIPLSQYQQLVCWKENGRKAVNEFLAGIQTWYTTIDKTIWDDAVAMLEKEKKKTDLKYEINRSQRTIEVITSNQGRLSDLKEKLQNIQPAEKQTDEQIDVNILNYKTLEAAGVLTALESSNPKTSTTIDHAQNKLIFRGPTSEVSRMKTEILYLLANTQTVAVAQSKERIHVLKSSEGRKVLQKKLAQQKLSEDFEIKGSYCEICIYLETDSTLREVEKRLKECISSIFQEEKYTVPDNLVENLQRDKELETALKKIERLNNNMVVISMEEKVIICTGISSVVKKAIESIKQHLQGNRVDKSVAYFQRNIVTYIETYRQNYDLQNCTFMKNKDGILTGEIFIEGKGEKIKETEQALKKEAERISTFWFHLKRPWLANIVMNLDTLQTVAENLKCLMQPEIGDTLAEVGVSIAAVSRDGTAVQIISCDITTQDTDVIVNAANVDLQMIGGLAKAISDAAGSGVQDECTHYIEANGTLSEGDVVFTSPGKLLCCELLHVVGPQWKGGNSNEKNILQTAILNILNMVNERHYLSVMIPAISCGIFGYPNNLATEHIVEAVCSFVSKNPDSSVKEIYLCDTRKELITHFENAVKKVLQKEWFIFEHKRTRQQTPPKIYADTVKDASRARSRPKSGRPGQRTDILGKSLRWGRGARSPSPRPTQTTSSVGSSDEESDTSVMIPQRRQNFDLPGGLPICINLTSKTSLTVVKGRIENQQQDVIVCTTPHFPEVVGAVANALVRNGGDSIITECRKKGNLQFGDVICTGKGSLSCKQLFHVRTLMDWNDNSGPENIRQIVAPCLQEAEKQEYASLAFPAIGTGASHYPADQVAEIMAKTITEYLESNAGTGIEEIRIVIYERDTLTAQTFESVVPKVLVPSDQAPHPKDTGLSKARKEKQNKSTDTETTKVKQLRVKYVEPAQVENHSEADDVVLIQVTTAGSSLKEIKQQAKTLLDIEFLTRTIDFKTLTDEHRLTDEEIKRLKQLNTTKVNLDIDQRATKVTITGLRADVKKADNDACNLLRTEFPQRRKQKKIEALIVDFVQWQVSDGNQGNQDVSIDINFVLETNFERGVDFKYQNNDVEYQVLIQSLEEHPVQNPLIKRKLYRRIRVSKDAGICLPDIWAISGTAEAYKELEISANDPIFNEVKKKFTDAGCKPNSVDKILQIENRSLYLQYEVMKKKFQIRNTRGMQNERELWHGSDAGTIKLICQKGFDRSYAGRNATAYGKGVYFATSSEYSHRYASAGSKPYRMILSKVLTGEYIYGQSDMVAPPNKPNKAELYDSLVDNSNNPSIFVIFHDTQAYPQYVIEYT